MEAEFLNLISDTPNSEPYLIIFKFNHYYSTFSTDSIYNFNKGKNIDFEYVFYNLSKSEDFNYLRLFRKFNSKLFRSMVIPFI